MNERHIGALLGILFGFFLSNVALAKYIVVDEFKLVENPQKTPVWCWASVIQMLLNKNGIGWSQIDVVKAIKGSVVVETATSREITGFLNSWGFDYDGSRWKSVAVRKPGAPATQQFIQELERNQPMILTFQTGPYSGHLVIAYGAVTKELRGGKTFLDGVVIYDPYTGKVKTLSRNEFFSSVKEHWFVSINKNQTGMRILASRR